MKARLIAIYVFNLIDIIATLTTTQSGFVEINPVAALLLQSTVLFVEVKFAAGLLVVCWLWHNRSHRLARLASWIVFIMYGVVALYYAGILLAFI